MNIDPCKYIFSLYTQHIQYTHLSLHIVLDPLFSCASFIHTAYSSNIAYDGGGGGTLSNIITTITRSGFN